MDNSNPLFAFVLCSCRKTITINIVDREAYEKQDRFFIALGEPVWNRRGVKGVRVIKDILRIILFSLCVLLSHWLSPLTLLSRVFVKPDCWLFCFPGFFSPCWTVFNAVLIYEVLIFLWPVHFLLRLVFPQYNIQIDNITGKFQFLISNKEI